MSTDYRPTVFLPQTGFAMRGELPKREPEILTRWQAMDLYGRQRAASKGREKFVLHDGPPYANGNLHIGHALNKILKDVINRTQQMLGRDANYVPGWDCHGLPIEWKIEESYRAAGRDKDAVPVNEFRRECREFAAHWIEVQKAEFMRMGVVGDWARPYTTMSFAAEAQIARELHKFAANGLLYRGSKPVLWSVVEKTALAEAEVEYDDFVSDQIWVKFPVATGGALAGASVAIWTTTPWTIPGNRAICFSSRIAYGLYKVTDAPADNWMRTGETIVVADKLADSVFKQARVTAQMRLREVTAAELAHLVCVHPLAGYANGYGYAVPLLDGDHVTDDAGTGFVHTAPSHGREDFEIWMASTRALAARGVDPAIPYMVDENGAFTAEAPGFVGKRVFNDKGDKGDANEAVIAALRDARALMARGRMTHQYPHSWRSKKPLLFRNTPQWFIAMDKDIAGVGDTLRARALAAIGATRWVPAQGENRITGMIESRPDWVISRQRAWGVPIAVFANAAGEVLRDETVDARIVAAFEAEGADAWFAEGAAERFLGGDHSANEWHQVRDIVDVWFDSGATHSFVLEGRDDLQWPASLYLEGSDQHRGWFHSSLLEACGTRGRAPYEAVLTHGFVMAEDGRKMSKSLGNVVAPQDTIKQYGADILRIWVVSSDYSEDLRIGPEILKHQADLYRRVRNTLRFLLGSLAGFADTERVPAEAMPELERWVLHRLWELDRTVRAAADAYDFHTLWTALHTFCAVDLSAFYFDVRKDALYCDAPDSARRRACRSVLAEVFERLTAWLAPVLCFTAEEAWLARDGAGPDDSVHLRVWAEVPAAWRDDALAAKWERVRRVRRVVTGALEIERAEKRIGASLEAAPRVFVADPALVDAVGGVDIAEVCIVSAIDVVARSAPDGAFALPEVAGVGVLPARADGAKCARCWQVLPEVGAAPRHDDLCRRCDDAVGDLPVAAQ
ncbi:MAG: isoleucine--tRNA ligase [Alphaproteobacteria bacterium]|nr:isoleucine--tRNA ligase [Alphaproteobacteria bacterium]